MTNSQAHTTASSVRPLVLVADDDEMIRVVARAVLEKSGLRVSEAIDGEDALQRLGTGEPYALVLLDLNMPHVDGMEVLRSIRSNPVTANLPVIVLTGSDADEDVILAMAAGANDCMRKPMAPDVLWTRVKAVLGPDSGS